MRKAAKVVFGLSIVMLALIPQLAIIPLILMVLSWMVLCAKVDCIKGGIIDFDRFEGRGDKG